MNLNALKALFCSEFMDKARSMLKASWKQILGSLAKS